MPLFIPLWENLQYDNFEPITSSSGFSSTTRRISVLVMTRTGKNYSMVSIGPLCSSGLLKEIIIIIVNFFLTLFKY